MLLLSYAGCNNFNGAVKFNGNTIAIGDLAVTRMMCEPSVSGQETVFLEADQCAKVG